MKVRVNIKPILKYIGLNRFTYDEFCELTGVSLERIQDILLQKVAMVSEVIKISRLMKVNLYELV